MLHRRAWVLAMVVFVTAASPACATGEIDEDVDTGTTRVDARADMARMDAGRDVAADTGPRDVTIPMDAPPDRAQPVDVPPPMDVREDRTMPPVDMGPPPVDMGPPPVDMGAPPDMGPPPADMGTFPDSPFGGGPGAICMMHSQCTGRANCCLMSGGIGFCACRNIIGCFPCD